MSRRKSFVMGKKMLSVDSLELERTSGPSGDEHGLGEFVQGRDRETGDGR